MEIRKAEFADLPRMMEIYAQARDYMRRNGNPTQWVNGYPSEEKIREDITAGESWLCTENGEILGVFCFFLHNDPTYDVIYEGSWLNDEPYGVIHRIAVAQHRRGVASFCYDFALSKCTNLRIDTHRDNVPMQRSLQKNGFHRCGIIHLQNGDPRIAFQKQRRSLL